MQGAEKELDQLDAMRVLLEGLLDCAQRGEGGEGSGGGDTAVGGGWERHGRELHLHLIGPEVPSCGVVTTTMTTTTTTSKPALQAGDDAQDNGDDADGDRRAAKRRRRHTRSRSGGGAVVTIYTHRGLYHEVVVGHGRPSAAAGARGLGLRGGGDDGEEGDEESSLLPPPALVVAPNAGLAAFTSWMPTVRVLLAASAPVVLTDFTEEAACMGAALLAEAVRTAVGGGGCGGGGRRMLPVARNPFRQPMSSMGNDNALPTYSNGFTFGFLSTHASTPS